jgi:threonine/homoserine/homoserine lactone efflux protein
MRRVDIVASLPAFLLAVVLISASPGPAMALILRRAALHGFRAAVPTVLGLELGLYVWAVLAGAGLAALVAASQTAYLVLRVVGAAVLIYLGAQAWRAALRDRRTGTVEDDVPDPPRKARWAFGEGVRRTVRVHTFHPLSLHSSAIASHRMTTASAFALARGDAFTEV